MRQSRVSGKLLLVLGATAVLAVFVVGRGGVSGDSRGDVGFDSGRVTAFEVESDDDTEIAPWTPPANPRNPFRPYDEITG